MVRGWLQFMLDTPTRKRGGASENMSKSIYDTELYGLLQATGYARKWTARDPETDTIWIFVEPGSHQKAPLPSCNSRTTHHPDKGRRLVAFACSGRS